MAGKRPLDRLALGLLILGAVVFVLLLALGSVLARTVIEDWLP